MAARRDRVIGGLRELQRVCRTTPQCSICDLLDVCTAVDKSVNDEKEIEPCKLKLPNE